MRQVHVLKNNHGYAFVDGRLIECDVKKQLIHWDADGNFDYQTFEIEHLGKTIFVEPKDFFESVTAFRSGKNHGEESLCWDSLYLCRYMPDINLGDAKTNNSTFIIEDGRVKKHDFVFETIEVVYEDGKVVSMSSPDVPEKRWMNEENANAHLSVEVVSANGTMKKIPSLSELITLTDEQRSVMDDIIALTKKANEMGIEIVTDYNGVYAFNKNNLNGYEYDYDNCSCERIDVLSREFLVDMDVTIVSEDCMLNITRKDEE